jgi:hypothetical protein
MNIKHRTLNYRKAYRAGNPPGKFLYEPRLYRAFYFDFFAMAVIKSNVTSLLTLQLAFRA